MGFFDFFKDDKSPLIEQSLADMDFMLERAEDMVKAAAAYLLDNAPLTMDLKERDQAINQREREIRRAVLEHLAVDPRRDMVFSLILVSIVQDAERIGDLAKSIANAAHLAHGDRGGPHLQPLHDLRERILVMFAHTRQGFVASDASAGRRVMEENDRIKRIVKDYLQTLANSENITPNEAVVFTLSARLIGRVASHLSNIVSAVVMPFDQIRRSPTWAEDDKT